MWFWVYIAEQQQQQQQLVGRPAESWSLGAAVGVWDSLLSVDVCLSTLLRVSLEVFLVVGCALIAVVYMGFVL